MSSTRVAVPILMALGFGVVNGALVFSPAFKEQKRAKEDAQQAVEAARQSESSEVSLKDANAEEIPAIATKYAQKSDTSVKSWWPSLSLWSQETNIRAETLRDKPHIEHNQVGK